MRYLFAVALLCAGVGLLMAAEVDVTKAKCPVSGKAVKAESSAAYKGGKVYFCCDNCPKAFAANTAKFAAKANHQLVVTGQAKQTACPLAGRKCDPSTAITIDGAKVCFCCNNCKGKATAASGDKQLELVFGAKFDKAFKVGKK